MNEQTSAMMSQSQHQQQMMNMNMNQNPQQMMNMNQHQPQQQVMVKPPHPNPPRNYAQLNPNNYLVKMMNNTHSIDNNDIIGNRNHLKNPQSNKNLQMMLNQPPPSQPMMNRSYAMWAPPLPPPSMEQLKFQNPNPKMKAMVGGGLGFVSGKQQHQGMKPLGPRSNWKGKKVNDKRKDVRRKESIGMSVMAGTSSGLGGISAGGGGGYKPPMLNELQHQNRMKARRFFPKKKFSHHYYNNNDGGNNMGKFAPRNTSSFIIRAKKSGGIAELVSPAQGTPAVLPTPIFSPSREVLVDMAKEEWGVDGYGSMKGLIRLRSPGREDELHDGDEEEDEGGSSESDVEEHVEVERRLDHDLSRFEMIYPNSAGGMDYSNVLENRVDDQDTHIAQLEEENLILKERLFLMERELGDLRRRLQCLERQSHGGDEINEEVVENESENDSESREEAHSMEDNNDEFVGENTEGSAKVKEEDKDVDDEIKAATGDKKDEVKAASGGENVGDIEGKEEKDNDMAIAMKDENMGDNVEVKVENNDGKVGEQEYHDEVKTGGLEITAAADVNMDEVPRGDNNGIEDDQCKDKAAGNE